MRTAPIKIERIGNRKPNTTAPAEKPGQLKTFFRAMKVDRYKEPAYELTFLIILFAMIALFWIVKYLR